MLGALLTISIAQAALSRADTPAADRRTFYLYADEFQSFATESFALILSEARKYALTLTIGHQCLDQLPDRLRAAVFGNVGSLITCRAGAADAPILAEQIGLGGPDALLDLSNFTAWARLLRNGGPSSPIYLDLPPPQELYVRGRRVSRFYCVAGDLHGAPQADEPLGSLLPCNPFFATIDGKVRGTV